MNDTEHAELVLEIKRLIALGYNYRQVGEILSYSQSGIAMILKRARETNENLPN